MLLRRLRPRVPLARVVGLFLVLPLAETHISALKRLVAARGGLDNITTPGIAEQCPIHGHSAVEFDYDETELRSGTSVPPCAGASGQNGATATGACCGVRRCRRRFQGFVARHANVLLLDPKFIR